MNDEAGDETLDDELATLFAEASQEDALWRRYPVQGGLEQARVSHCTAYSAMVLEPKGWRQMFPALPDAWDARDSLADILRGLARRHPQRAVRLEEAAAEITDGADQVVLGSLVYRVVRVEQTVVMTEYGPQAPRPDDRSFPEELDDRNADDL